MPKLKPMSKRIKYEAKLMDRNTQIEMGWKKGTIRIREKDSRQSIADRIAEKHRIDLQKIEIEIRLKQFTLKQNEK